jgi:predicted aspartyl protease
MDIFSNSLHLHSIENDPSASVALCIISVSNRLSSHYHVPIQLCGLNNSIRLNAMIDSGATGLFLNKRVVDQHKIMTLKLKQRIPLHNIDGSKNKAGGITHYARLNMKIGDTAKKTNFFITDIGPEDIILSLPWLKEANPIIDWEEGKITLDSGAAEIEPLAPFTTLKTSHTKRHAWVKSGLLEDFTDEIWCCASMTYSTQLAAEVNEKKYSQPLKEMVSTEYLKHKKIFSEEESHRLPKHQS